MLELSRHRQSHYGYHALIIFFSKTLSLCNNDALGSLNNPLSCLGDTGVSYVSTNGLLLLSKIPLSNAVADSFNIAAGEIQLVPRGYLSAEVSISLVYCMDMHSDLSLRSR